MKKIKQFACILTSLSLSFCLLGCNSDDKDSSIEETIAETTENSMLQSEYDKLKHDYELLLSDFNRVNQELNEMKNSSTEKPTEATDTQNNEISNQTLYEDENLKITYKGITYEASRTNLNLTIENYSNEGITVQVRDVSVNGIMVKPIFSCDIVGGKKANDGISFRNLEDEGIEKIESIEFYFHVYESKTHDKIVDTDPITIDISE